MLLEDAQLWTRLGEIFEEQIVIIDTIDKDYLENSQVLKEVKWSDFDSVRELFVTEMTKLRSMEKTLQSLTEGSQDLIQLVT